MLLVVKSFNMVATRAQKQEELKWELAGKLPSPPPSFLHSSFSFTFICCEDDDSTVVILSLSSSLALQARKMKTNNATVHHHFFVVLLQIR